MGEGKVDLCCVISISRVLSEVEVAEKDEVVKFLGIRTVQRYQVPWSLLV